jgi:hypothetical protein
LLGEIRFERAYYHCPQCSRGFFPWDDSLRIASQRLTPAAREVVSLAGIQESFGKAADRTLYKLAGLRLSESTVERTTETAGDELGRRLQAGERFGEDRPYAWNKDARGKTCAYVSLDATGILMQGEHGSKVEGRMVTVGMIFNPQPRPVDDDDATLSKPCDGVRYLAGLYDLGELGLQMRRQGAQVGMDAADVWIALTDGGNGLERFIDVNFPRAEKILDFQHAAGYVGDFAKAYRPGVGEKAERAQQRLQSAWCHTLKHAGGRRLIAVLERLDRDKMTEAAATKLDELMRYLNNNVDRMDYGRYLKNGWQIASGAVESACKTVVNHRLCCGGMRWSEEGSDAVAHLRALYRSDPDQWDVFWAIAA